MLKFYIVLHVMIVNSHKSLYQNMQFLRPGISIFGIMLDHLGTVLTPCGTAVVIQGSLGTLNWTPWGLGLDFC